MSAVFAALGVAMMLCHVSSDASGFAHAAIAFVTLSLIVKD